VKLPPFQQMSSRLQSKNEQSARVVPAAIGREETGIATAIAAEEVEAERNRGFHPLSPVPVSQGPAADPVMDATPILAGNPEANLAVNPGLTTGRGARSKHCPVSLWRSMRIGRPHLPGHLNLRSRSQGSLKLSRRKTSPASCLKRSRPQLPKTIPRHQIQAHALWTPPMIFDFHIGRRIAARVVEAALVVDAMGVKDERVACRKSRTMRVRAVPDRNPVR
jgi:hypothetical protein